MKYLTLLILIIIVSCGAAGRLEKTADNWGSLEAELDALFNKNINSGEPGLAFLVAYENERIYSKGFGLRNIESKEIITDSTNFELASVSKQFSALCILALADQNKLQLNDTASRYLGSDVFRSVLIRELITHTSGLDDAEAYFYKHWDSTKIASNADVLNWYIEKNKTIKGSDKEFKYNNGAYELLPILVEKLSGQPFPEFIKESIFDKAGMQNSIAFNLNNPVKIAQRANCYHQNLFGKWEMTDGDPLTGIVGAGGIYTSLNDYFNYLTALRNKTILSGDSHDLIFSPAVSGTSDGETFHYGMGWFVTDSFAQHTGGWAGVNTFSRIYLNKPLSVVLFANRDDIHKKEIFQKAIEIVKKHIPD
ncbi:MAG: serine hydrolase domain-containing protein [Bacteroidia bacterium]